jgi:hypothetical protein
MRCRRIPRLLRAHSRSRSPPVGTRPRLGMVVQGRGCGSLLPQRQQPATAPWNAPPASSAVGGLTSMPNEWLQTCRALPQNATPGRRLAKVLPSRPTNARFAHADGLPMGRRLVGDDAADQRGNADDVGQVPGRRRAGVPRVHDRATALVTNRIGEGTARRIIAGPGSRSGGQALLQRLQPGELDRHQDPGRVPDGQGLQGPRRADRLRRVPGALRQRWSAGVVRDDAEELRRAGRGRAADRAGHQGRVPGRLHRRGEGVRGRAPVHRDHGVGRAGRRLLADRGQSTAVRQ